MGDDSKRNIKDGVGRLAADDSQATAVAAGERMLAEVLESQNRCLKSSVSEQAATKGGGRANDDDGLSDRIDKLINQRRHRDQGDNPPKKITYNDVYIYPENRHESISSDRRGLIELNTGDKFVRSGSLELVITGNGDTVLVNRDGSFDVNAKDGARISHSKDGSTTVELKNGKEITIRGGRVTDVRDGGASTHFNSSIDEFLPDWGGGSDIVPRPYRSHPYRYSEIDDVIGLLQTHAYNELSHSGNHGSGPEHTQTYTLPNGETIYGCKDASSDLNKR